MKKRKNSNTVSSNMSCSQNQLVDDKMKKLINFDKGKAYEKTLALLMSYLPIVDRIKCERVSKGWKAASQNSWSNYKLLNLSKKKWGFTSKGKQHEARRVTSKMINSVLIRCGKFLSTIDFEDLGGSNYELDSQYANEYLLSMISRHCKNLKSLKINGMDVCTSKGLTELSTNCKEISKLLLGDSSLDEECTYCDKKLAILFSKSQIESLEILFLPITGKCLSSLNTYLLHTLELIECEFLKPRFLIEFILDAKNLSNICFRGKSNVMLVIKALQRNCNNLTNLSLIPSLGSDENTEDIDEELSILFKNCNKLKTFTVGFCKLDGSCFLAIKADVIEEIKIHFCHDIEWKYLIECLPRFEKLIDLSFDYTDNDMDGKMIKSVGLCSNLKYLTIEKYYFSNYFLSNENGATCLSLLKNLESLKLKNSDQVTDNFLINICNYLKKLSYIDISSCKNVTDIGLKAITTLPNLEGLNIEGNKKITDKGFDGELSNIKILKCAKCKNLNNDGVLSIIKKSNKLEALDITECKSITNELIDSVIGITENRFIKTMLVLHIRDTGIDVDQIVNRSPFLELNTRWPCFRWRNKE